MHDVVLKDLGRAPPDGVYDGAQNQGWGTVGIDHDTAKFAVASMRQWWQTLGQATNPGATRLLITAAGGGSNGSRSRLWKRERERELQRFADETGSFPESNCSATPSMANGTTASVRVRWHLRLLFCDNSLGR